MQFSFELKVKRIEPIVNEEFRMFDMKVPEG
jgi:hypothetical protein